MTTARTTNTVVSMAIAKVVLEVAAAAAQAVVVVAAIKAKAGVIKVTATSVVAEAKDHLRLHRRHNLHIYCHEGTRW